MRFPKNCAIEKCVASSNRAIGTECVAYDAAAKSLVATDGHGMVILPVDEDGDVDGLIPPEAVSAARKAAPRGADAMLTVNGDVKLQDGRTWPKGVGRFPEWRMVHPKEEPAFRVTLDVALLAKLCAALGAHYATIEVAPSQSTPLRIVPVSGDGEGPVHGGYALLMRMKD